MKNNTLQDVVLGLFGLILIFIGVPYFIYQYFDWGFLISEITAYPIEGSGNSAYQLPATTFKVFADQQYVVVFKNGQFIRLGQCTIENLKNWQCGSSVGTSTVGFMNGNYFTIPENSNIHYVSKWNWNRASSVPPPTSGYTDFSQYNSFIDTSNGKTYTLPATPASTSPSVGGTDRQPNPAS